uniref:Heparanase-like protein 3 n=1 Tax=Ananas comosus var. bracteatus TaxID=296719 RepID=A0A6V7NF36_ANACO|nr:unnamed protein product [Ananas comosus var. bracteatus]
MVMVMVVVVGGGGGGGLDEEERERRDQEREREREIGVLLLQLLGFCFCFCFCFSPIGSAARCGGAVAVAVAVEGRYSGGGGSLVCATLDWWPPEKCDYGTCSWGLASLLNLNLSNPIQLNAIKDPRQKCTPFVKNDSEIFGFSEGCLPLKRWDELNDFFRKAGAVIIFGLNALNGRVPMPEGSLGGPWNYSNAASFIRYTVNRGYTIHGWELGNELSGNGVGARVGADQYAADVIAIKSIIDDIYQGFPAKPLVTALGGFFDAGWFSVDDHLIDKILDPSYLDGEASTFSNLQGILKAAGTKTVAWVGEAGGAYNSGHHLVTDSFVFSFWYLDQLGMASKITFEPNPDYYSALLWHRLMRKIALLTNFTGTDKLRAHAHCARQSQGITLLLINLSGNTTTQVFATTAPNNAVEWKILAVNSRGNIPKFEPIQVEASQLLTVAPFLHCVCPHSLLLCSCLQVAFFCCMLFYTERMGN